MALRIRLSRHGAKKRPFYWIVIADSRMPRDGRFKEKIGTYNPMLSQDNPERLKIDSERAKHWLSVGAQPSDRVQHFLATLKLADKPVQPKQTTQHLPKAKAQERLKEKAEKMKAAEEAKKAEAAQASAPVETPEEQEAEVAIVEKMAEAEGKTVAEEKQEAADEEKKD